jgi:hypothetical protein
MNIEYYKCLGSDTAFRLTAFINTFFHAGRGDNALYTGYNSAQITWPKDCCKYFGFKEMCRSLTSNHHMFNLDVGESNQ